MGVGALILFAAHLDDIHFLGKAFLLRPFTLILREIGLAIGLHFVTLFENYAYSPRTTRTFQGYSRTRCAASIRCVNDYGRNPGNTKGAIPSWVKAHARPEVTAEAMLFFAHIGLEGDDAATLEYVGPEKLKICTYAQPPSSLRTAVVRLRSFWRVVKCPLQLYVATSVRRPKPAHVGFF